ncbi:MAG: sporulation integral membrane protein YtvI [Clostridiales bacterium]|jgi:sporulation integral membrane protein YtvI|nr:sporulation integral membrane protein YtvI [Clostridiales bacterium]
MLKFYEENKRRINKLLTAILFAAVAYIFVKYIFRYVAPFVFGLIFSMMFEPLVSVLDKKWKIKRGITALLCIICILVLAGVLGAGAVSRIVREARGFAGAIPAYVSEVSLTLSDFFSRFTLFSDMFALEWNMDISGISEQIVQGIASAAGSLAKDASVTVVTRTPVVLLNVLMCLLSTFFFINDKPQLRAWFGKNMPDKLLSAYQLVKKTLFHALGAYLRTMSIMFSVIATINIVGLIVLRYPYALLMGLMIALLDALPVFGSGAVLWPWALISLIRGDYSFALGLIIIYGINFVTRHALEPRIMSEQIGLHPLITLLSVYVGLSLFGAAGVIAGPVIALILKAYLKIEYKLEGEL